MKSYKLLRVFLMCVAAILVIACDKTPRSSAKSSETTGQNGSGKAREQITCPENTPSDSPPGRICELYRQFPTRDRGNSDSPQSAFSAYFSPDLRKSVEDVSSIIDLIYLGYVPGIQGVRVESNAPGKVIATIATYGDETKTLIYTLKKFPEGWKIDNIRYPEGRTLRENFEPFASEADPTEADPVRRYALIRKRYDSLFPLLFGEDQSRTPSRTMKAIEAESNRLAALLDGMIDAVVGPIRMEGAEGMDGMERQKGNNLTSCGYSDGCTQIDGILFGDKGTKAVLVSTKALVKLFFEDWKEVGDLDALSKVDGVYTYAVGQDAGFESLFEIPIKTPDSLAQVRVYTGNFAQDLVFGSGFSQLVFFATRGDRVLIATQPVQGWTVRACEEAWKKAGSNYTDEAHASYSKCYQEKAAAEPGYPDLVQRAQNFAARLGTIR